MSNTNKANKTNVENSQYQEASNDVDYRVRVKQKPKPQVSNWQKIIIALMVITLLATLAIALIQSSRITSLESRNSNLVSTVEVLQTQNADLQSTVESLKKFITPTPTPKP